MQRKNKQTVPLIRQSQSPPPAAVISNLHPVENDTNRSNQNSVVPPQQKPTVSPLSSSIPPSHKVGGTSSSTTGGGNIATATATVVRNYFGTSPFDQHWLNVDCCGLFCALLTYCLHIYGVYAVCYVVIPPWMSYENVDGIRQLSSWGIFHTLLFITVALLAVFSHFKAMTTDPGAVPPDAEPVPDDLENPLQEKTDKKSKRGKRLCRRCNAFKPDRAHHCSICKRCIIKMDHHCPWVNNCVGIGNHKYFLLFILYTFLSCTYSLTLLIVRMFICAGNVHGEDEGRCLDKPSHLMVCIGLVVEAVLFGLFTSCMMCDQWEVVLTNITHIDRLKGEVSKIPEADGMNEVFGIGRLGRIKGNKGNGNFRLDWLSPFVNVCFPESVHDDVMGFCRPCGYSKPLSIGRKKKEEEELELMSSSSIGSNAAGRKTVGNAADMV